MADFDTAANPFGSTLADVVQWLYKNPESVKHALIGNPDAKIPMRVDENGYPLMNYNIHEFKEKYPGLDHPIAEAGAMGGMLATGAPELAARSLLAPVVNAGKQAIKAAPLTTAGITGAAATTIPTNSGKTPWDTMMEDWARREGDVKTKMGVENQTIKGIEDSILAKAGALATPGTPRYERQQAQIKALREQSKGTIDPAQARLKEYQAQLDAIGKERVDSQTPIRQAHPAVGLTIPPIAWGAAGLTGAKIGKYARGAQDAKVQKMEDVLGRTEQHIAKTTTATGKANKNQFNNPEGQGLADELNALKGTKVRPAGDPAVAALLGTGVGGAEGMLAPLALTGMDAMIAPTGSPLQGAAARAPGTGAFWEQSVPEIGVAAGAGGLSALAAALSRGKGKGYGPAVAPTERLNSMATSARAAQVPKPALAAPKGKPKGQDLTMPANLPDL